MKMKKTIKLIEVDNEGKDIGVPSKLSLKTTGKGLLTKRKLKLKNNGGLWTDPDKTRMTVTLSEDDENNVVIKLQDGRKVEMHFLDLCNLKDILSHVEELGMTSTFGKTVVKK